MKPVAVKHSLLFFFLLFFSANQNLRAQYNVVPVSQQMPDPEKEGILYALPLNIVSVDISVTKTEYFKGPFADYAMKYLGLSNVIRENSVKYAINHVNTGLLADPDPSHLYFIQFDNKSKGKEISIALTEKGIISGFTEVDLKNNHSFSQAQESGTYQQQLFRDLLKSTITEKIDTIIRRVSVDTTTIEERIVRRSLSEKSAEQMAKETAETIRKIDENIFNLITGYQEVNYSKESLQYMIAELRKTQNEYLSLFKGTTRTTSDSHQFYVTPQANEDGLLESLCKFSPTGGITSKSSPVGDYISLSVTPLNVSKPMKEFAAEKELLHKKSRGLYYRIPQQAKVRVTQGVKVLSETTEMISQFGVVTHLPAGSYSDLIFNPVTGAISHISFK